MTNTRSLQTPADVKSLLQPTWPQRLSEDTSNQWIHCNITWQKSYRIWDKQPKVRQVPYFSCGHSNTEVQVPYFSCGHSNTEVQVPYFSCGHSHTEVQVPYFSCGHSHTEVQVPYFSCGHSHTEVQVPYFSCERSNRGAGPLLQLWTFPHRGAFPLLQLWTFQQRHRSLTSAVDIPTRRSPPTMWRKPRPAQDIAEAKPHPLVPWDFTRLPIPKFSMSHFTIYLASTSSIH